MEIYSSVYFRLTFNEANIFMENYKGRDKASLLIHLENLSENSYDEILRHSTISLLKKIATLSDDQYAKLVNDASQEHILYPPNYFIE